MEAELQTFQIAGFALKTRYDDIGNENTDQLKKHLLDSLGSLIHSTNKPTINKLVNQISFLGEGGVCKVPLLGDLPVDRAAQLYTALIRYPDFMDNFMSKEATCHPSDNLGSLLAVSQIKETTGKDFLTAMAIAYQVQCRLVEEIPVMKEGIDHTLTLTDSLVAAVSKMLGLTREQTAHAIGIGGCSMSPLVTSRASYTYEWKGLASSLDAFNAMQAVLMAREGITGPVALFEGPKGFHEIFGMKLDYDWSKETFGLIRKCVLKRYNAEVHSQSTVDAAVELRTKYDFNISDIEKVEVTTFLTAYHIIGSGAYGDRKIVHSKEQADHSLFYLVAVALIDGDIYPEQFAPERIEKKDVQDLLQKVFVHTGLPIHKPLAIAGTLDPYTHSYPDKMKTKVKVILRDGREFTCEKEDFPGFFTRPFTWEQTIEKFRRISSEIIDEKKQDRIISTVRDLEKENIATLITLIAEPAKAG